MKFEKGWRTKSQILIIANFQFLPSRNQTRMRRSNYNDEVSNFQLMLTAGTLLFKL
jgi:hypothetical protein